VLFRSRLPVGLVLPIPYFWCSFPPEDQIYTCSDEETQANPSSHTVCRSPAQKEGSHEPWTLNCMDSSVFTKLYACWWSRHFRYC